jgi:hypothetical protein
VAPVTGLDRGEDKLLQRLCSDTPRESSQKEKNMTTSQRFVLDENGYVIDKLNSAGNPVLYFYGDDTPKDEVRLRESVPFAASWQAGR